MLYSNGSYITLMCLFVCCSEIAVSQALHDSSGKSRNLEIKNKALENAKSYLRKEFTSTIFSAHFIENKESSLIIYSDYKTFFDREFETTQPAGYEIRFDVAIASGLFKDTFYGVFYIYMDSEGNVQEDSLKSSYFNQNLEAWYKVFFKKYKFNYDRLTQFILARKIDNYEINFEYDFDLYNRRHIHKYYWYLTCNDIFRTGRSKDVLQYQIDPETGAMKKRWIKEPVLPGTVIKN